MLTNPLIKFYIRRKKNEWPNQEQDEHNFCPRQ